MLINAEIEAMLLEARSFLNDHPDRAPVFRICLDLLKQADNVGRVFLLQNLSGSMAGLSATESTKLATSLGANHPNITFEGLLLELVAAARAEGTILREEEGAIDLDPEVVRAFIEGRGQAPKRVFKAWERSRLIQRPKGAGWSITARVNGKVRQVIRLLPDNLNSDSGDDAFIRAQRADMYQKARDTLITAALSELQVLAIRDEGASYDLVPQWTRDTLTKMGLDPKEALKFFREQGWLRASTDTGTTISSRIDGTVRSVIRIVLRETPGGETQDV